MQERRHPWHWVASVSISGIRRRYSQRFLQPAQQDTLLFADAARQRVADGGFIDLQLAKRGVFRRVVGIRDALGETLQRR